ncbi:hypothetical protein N9C70_02440 [Flavobacteriales bacterium]|nr:hypothetical protein [Flavobacteriales bacterium]
MRRSILMRSLADGHDLPSSCSAELNENGAQGIGDLLFFLTAFDQTGNGVTDLNGDGVTPR